ncbi:hypothetical protein BDV95DRAFT_588034 [Massariosphaeria phaeospora]|uniref:Uncharacterized protein n=1 Tax=Massariosphaeria phaeospora TaxID=100035 RepID=A0A7C8HYI4_9PLEO|nr:hypothetical protein BDV95DRAFT_588034 [Massariosphaeria phaeospora]
MKNSEVRRTPRAARRLHVAIVHLALLLLLLGGSAAFFVASLAALRHLGGVLRLVFGLRETSPSLTFSRFRLSLLVLPGLLLAFADLLDKLGQSFLVARQGASSFDLSFFLRCRSFFLGFDLSVGSVGSN